jgi:6-phosphogluconate dehydrogenase
MQPLSESHDLLARCARMGGNRLHHVVAAWNTTAASSYPAEITAQVFVHVLERTGGLLIDVNVEAAGQQGTGM